MAVNIRLIGDLRRLAGAESVELEGPGWSIGTAVDEVVRRCPRLGESFFDEGGGVRYSGLVVRNGRPVIWPRDRGLAVDDGDELVLMRFMAGG
ncbi:MAG: MoaD/ThiS family protein [Thermoleophilia bacterium]|nr:MoaD/ThiS family protein [Thermoleophilia bacterium]